MPDYSTWLTKQQAADALQCATKTVEQLSTQGKLQSVLYKRPEGGPKLRVYHPDDVERLRKERNPEAEAFVLPAETKPSTSLQRVGNNFPTSGYIQPIMERLMETRPAVTLREKVFLTMPEAVQLTGLPDGTLRRMLNKPENDEEAALGDHGIMTGQGWRVRRKDLEAL